MTNPAQVLIDFQPKHEFFVGIDSDGCAFDAMEIKHKECFIPNTIKHWGLQPVSTLTRETAAQIRGNVEVNGYSVETEARSRSLLQRLALVGAP